MKEVVFCVMLAVCVGLSGCDSDSGEETAVETAVVDGVEVNLEDVEKYMRQSGVTAEEAERDIRAGIAKARAEGRELPGEQ